ncbi:MAG: helix-turn-helix domain-containing protein [Clostridia bacterium]|jgi:excisionase family DNA binding protein|nr:helix-turn-helix domain-containing protein [Clostridia bacterium]MCI2000681.1 helix-turn-helix domain-containing protein [Clostridia bacterium]MCI2015246.1 helix-turn-helix domain-containing protein [Clostridia bacterium]
MLDEYPDILTSKEVMEILGISKNTLYELIKNGEIPVVRLGKKLRRINKKSLLKFIYTYHNILLQLYLFRKKELHCKYNK